MQFGVECGLSSLYCCVHYMIKVLRFKKKGNEGGINIVEYVVNLTQCSAFQISPVSREISSILLLCAIGGDTLVSRKTKTGDITSTLQISMF